ncbi:hypothetical protein KW786_02710 [Candidatus Parcubacteria bacterium]|nr:hypothetical protein [Candidatus Parcubacteria bacterium]
MKIAEGCSLDLDHAAFPQREGKMTKLLVGVSAVECVREVVQGIVLPDDVKKIVSDLRLIGSVEVDEVAEVFRRGRWSSYGEQAVILFREWLRSGKIEMPRLHGRRPVIITGVIWLNSEDEIQWKAEG